MESLEGSCRSTLINIRRPGARTGFFFFEVSSEIGNLRRENTLKNWEQITATLYKQEGYKEEPFFWTILGLRDGAADTVTDTDRFEQWNAHVQANKDYTLLVYIFHPLFEDNWTPKTTQLQLTSSLDLSSSYSHDLIVDSPYDLRRWSFKIKPEGIHFGERASDPNWNTRYRTASNTTNFARYARHTSRRRYTSSFDSTRAPSESRKHSCAGRSTGRLGNRLASQG